MVVPLLGEGSTINGAIPSSCVQAEPELDGHLPAPGGQEEVRGGLPRGGEEAAVRQGLCQEGHPAGQVPEGHQGGLPGQALVPPAEGDHQEEVAPDSLLVAADLCDAPGPGDQGGVLA